MKISAALNLAKELAARLRTNQSGFEARAAKETSDVMQSTFKKFAGDNAREAESVEMLIASRAALLRELSGTADKLSWLREANREGIIISAEDIRQIEKQLAAARATLKNSNL